MASTKSNTAILNQSLTDGGADVTSTTMTMTTSYGGSLSMALTNGGTGPTVPARLTVEISNDNSNWHTFAGPFNGSTTAGAAAEFVVIIPKEVLYCRVVAGGNTGQAVTALVNGAQVTAI